METDFFLIFGLKRRFGIDRKDLESRFYRLSRELHPDRFSTAGPEARRHSHEQMSLVNEAYQTLKNPEKLRDYLLRLELGSAQQAKPQLPTELAESWFELQDALSASPEHSAEVQERLRVFTSELTALRERGRQQMQALEVGIDRQLEQGKSAMSLFEQLSQLILAQSYLDSLDRNRVQHDR